MSRHTIVANTKEPSDSTGSSSPDFNAYVARIRAGDDHAFELVYRALAEELINFAASLVGEMAVARDVVGDVFIDVWTRRASWAPQGGVHAYLFLAVRHRAMNALRDRRRHDLTHRVIGLTDESPGMAAPAMPVDRALDRAEQIGMVLQTLARLPEARRMAMTLRWRHELSIAEIAEAMGISQDAVKQHLSRGLRTLKQLLPDGLE